MSSAPWQLISAYPMSSVTMSTTLGFSVAARVVASAAPEKHETYATTKTIGRRGFMDARPLYTAEDLNSVPACDLFQTGLLRISRA